MKINKDVLKRYTEGTATDAERALVESWIEGFSLNDNATDEAKLLEHVKRLDKRIKGAGTKRVIWMWCSVAAAAAILLVSVFATYFLLNNKRDINRLTNIEDIKAPISSNTILTLENNEQYSLDSLKIGDTIKTENYLLTKLETGELNYIRLNGDSEPIYNKLKTVAGGIAQVRLSDGTLVWLNANSELTYPISFEANEREVSLIGEGYFEVAAALSDQKRKAFYVRGGAHTIQVLGTKFNANFKNKNEVALMEGHVKIAAEGSVLNKISPMNFNVDLYPNQLYTNGAISTKHNIRKYIDWKEGYFDLTDTKLSDLVVKLSDWYGVKIKSTSKLDQHTLFGNISRRKNLKDVLDIIAEATPITYKLQGDTIVITEK